MPPLAFLGHQSSHAEEAVHHLVKGRSRNKASTLPRCRASNGATTTVPVAA